MGHDLKGAVKRLSEVAGDWERNYSREAYHQQDAAHLRALLAELSRLQEGNERLRTALDPFVRATASLDTRFDDETKITIEMPTTRRSGRPVSWVYVEDVKRARALASQYQGGSDA